MSEAHDRRSFFRELLRGASRAAEELGRVREAAESSTPLASDTLAGFGPTPDAPVAAAPAERLATPEDLRELCSALERDSWADEATSLARLSIRLTPGGDGSSWLGGSPVVSREFAWPTEGGEPLPFLAEIRLDGLPDTPLPSEGVLLVFASLDDAAFADDARACAVRHVSDAAGEPLEGDGGLPLVPVVASAELTLPSEPESFEADAWELSQWTELRERLAALQGTELEETAPDYHAVHRLLGYADALIDPAAPSPTDEASAWQLLFQLSGDDELGVSFGPYARLLLWVHEDDLCAGRFDRVRASIG